MYSFLSLTWTFLAKCDIDSEKYRAFGSARFMMAAAMKLLSRHKRHMGRVRYLVASEPEAHSPTTASSSPDPPKYHEQVRDPLASKPAMDCFTEESKHEWRELTEPFHIFSAMNVSHAGPDCFVTPPAVIDDGYFHVLVVAGAFSRLHLTQAVLSVENGSHVNVDQMELIRTRTFSMQIDNPEDRVCVDGERVEGTEIKVDLSATEK